MLMGSPAPLQPKVAQKFRASGNAVLSPLLSPAWGTSVLSAGICEPALEPCWEAEPAQPEPVPKFAPGCRTLSCRTIFVNSCFLLAVSRQPEHLLAGADLPEARGLWWW